MEPNPNDPMTFAEWSNTFDDSSVLIFVSVLSDTA